MVVVTVKTRYFPQGEDLEKHNRMFGENAIFSDELLSNNVDLNKFSKEFLSERLALRGLTTDDVCVTAINDWKLRRAYTLTDGYIINSLVEGIYDGNVEPVKSMVERGWQIRDFMFKEYKKITPKTDENVLLLLDFCSPVDREEITTVIKATENAGEAVRFYFNNGTLINTKDGIYMYSVDLREKYL